MATATRTTEATPLCCPECSDGEAEVVMLVDRPGGRCRCLGCDAEFTPAEAAARFAAMAARWERLARWVSDAPAG